MAWECRLRCSPIQRNKSPGRVVSDRRNAGGGASLGFTREQIRHHFHAAHKERAKWPHRHEPYDEDNEYKAKHPSHEEEARRVLVHEQSWYCCNYREDSITNPIEHLLDPVEPRVFAATISASKSGWGSRNRHCPLSGGMCCKTRLLLAIGFGGEFWPCPCPALPIREYGLNASVPKLDATPTRSKRRPPVAANGREA